MNAAASATPSVDWCYAGYSKTRSASAQGFAGPVAVDVTIENNAITALVIGDEQFAETQGFGAKAKEEADRHLLTAEIYIGVLGTVILFACVFTAAFAQMADWTRAALILAGFVPFGICIGYAVKIEQKAGYYECAKCGHKYVPTYKSVLNAPHVNRTRYMKCPECGEKSWQKKRISKD